MQPLFQHPLQPGHPCPDPEQSHLSYWDALIVVAAVRSGATILYTEDMHQGTRYGTLKIGNPFLM